MFQSRESRIFTISQRFYLTNIKTEISSLWRCPYLHLLLVMENHHRHRHHHPSPPQHPLVTHPQSRLTPPPLESQGVVNRAVNEPSRSFSWWIVFISTHARHCSGLDFFDFGLSIIKDVPSFGKLYAKLMLALEANENDYRR